MTSSRPPDAGKWSSVVAAIGMVVLLGSTVVRWHQAAHAELTRDECYSWRMAGRSTDDIVSRSAEDGHPPGYYLLLRLWTRLASDSPMALRLPSVVAGVATVVCLALAFAFLPVLGRVARFRWPASLAVGTLAAVSSAQAAASTNARMYALGSFLTVLATVLTIATVNARQHGTALGVLLGGCLAGFCATHYYAVFTVAALFAFVALELVLGRPSDSPPTASERVRRLAVTAIVFVAAYAPLMAAAGHQVQTVRNGFWIEDATPESAARLATVWLLDCHPVGAYWPWLVLPAFALVAAMTLRRGGAAARLFLAVAFVPWLGAVAFTAATGRSILLERCFVFAHVGLIGFYGVAVQVLPLVPRGGLVVGLCVAATASVDEFWGTRPTQVAPWQQLFEAVARDVGPSDCVFVRGHRELNRARYYAARAGLRDVPVVGIRPQPSVGHVVHLSSLDDGELLPDVGAVFAAARGRVWWVGGDRGPAAFAPDGWRLGRQLVFEADGSSCGAILVVPDGPGRETR